MGRISVVLAPIIQKIGDSDTKSQKQQRLRSIHLGAFRLGLDVTLNYLVLSAQQGATHRIQTNRHQARWEDADNQNQDRI